jgi:PAS domain S-box-containing protein
MGETIVNPDIKKTFPWKLVMIFLLFSGVIIIMGRYYYRYERNRIFTEQEKSLSAIATLKIKQISQWYSDKLADAVVIKDNEPLVSRIKQFFKDENQTGIRKEINIWLEALNTQYDYNSVALLDTLLRVKITTSNADPLADESIRKELNNVIRYHKIIMTDLHKTGTSQAIRMDLLVPLLDSLSKEQKTIGLIILSIDPDKILFPLVQSWPTPSKSSETLILRKEGDSVLYLNELRHRKNTAFNLKFPLSKENLLATKAANGFEGVTEGTDYRNVPVIGALSKIPGLPWYMIAKTDKEEILAPFKRYSVITVLVIILLILINASIFGFWIWQQRIKFYRSQLKNESSIHELEERFTTAFRMSPVSVTISSVANNKFIDVNNTFLQDMEYTREEIIGRTAKELNIWADEGEREWIINEISEKGKIFGKVFSYKTKTGKTLYGLSSMSVVDVNGEPCNLSTVVNVTDARTAEKKLAEQYFTLKGIIESSRGPIFSLDKSYCYTSFNKVHSNIMKFLYGLDIEIGKNMLNYQTNDDDRIKAKANLDRALSGEYVEKSAWSGEDLKSRRFFEVTHNPIFNDVNEVIGVAVNARDLTERKLVDEKLRETNEYLSNLFNYANAPIIVWDTSLVITRFNHAFENLSGYSADEVIGKKIDILFPKEEIKSSLSLINKAVSGERWETVEIEIQRRDGDSRVVLWNSANIHDKDGKTVIATIAQGHDITERKLAEDALRESEDKFKYVFDHSLVAKSITLPSGEINVNRAFCDMLGYQPDELKKINWADISHPDDIKLTNDSLNLVLSGKKESVRFIKRYIHKSGSIVWADVGTSLRRDADNNPQYFMTSVNDITERKAAEEALRDSEERFSKSFRTSPISFMIANMEDGRIIEINDAFTGISGYTREEAIGNTTLNMKIWIHEEDRKQMIDSLRKGKPILHMETMLRTKEGNVAIVLLSAQVIKLANRNCIISSIEDITERKNAESQIKKLNEELEDRVIQRTELLEAANKELEAFSYSVSHDLRAPLRSVHGFTKILLEDYEANLDEEGKRICGIISSSATQMGELIDDLLSFSRIGRSSMNPSAIDMKKMAKAVFEGMTSPTERKRIKLNIGKLQKAVGDVALLGQVWTNLISNAIKYSSKNDVSEISIGSKIAGDMIIYFIKDNGVGFDMQYSHKLFGVFQRLHTESEFEGNGVGLAIVQRIIFKHGGKVWAEGEVGKGATFYFSLPAQDKRQSTFAKATVDKESKKTKV